MHRSEHAPRHNPILVISELDRNICTGVQRHFVDVIEFLVEQGRQVIFIGPDEFKERYAFRRMFFNLIARLGRPFGSYRLALTRHLTMAYARHELKKTLADRTHWTVYAQDPTVAAAALRLRQSLDQRVVLAVHYNGSQSDEMENRGVIPQGGYVSRMIRRWENQVTKEVDGIIVFSRFMWNTLESRGVELRKAALIPNTSSEMLPDSTLPSRDLIAIGTCEPRKNQAFLLKVLANATSRGYPYTLTIAGPGESLPALRQLAEELAITDQILFAGHVPNAASLLAGHKILVHAALMDNLPIVLVEALASGKPILAAPVGGIPEIFKDGIEGRYWNLDDIESSATILIDVVENQALLSRMGAAARRAYEEKFKRSAILKRLMDFLDTSSPS